MQITFFMTANIPEPYLTEVLVVPSNEDIEFLLSFLSKISTDIDLEDYDIPEVDEKIFERWLVQGEDDINYLEICESILKQWKKTSEIPNNIDILDEIYSEYVSLFFSENYETSIISDAMEDSSGLIDLVELVKARTIFRWLGLDLPDIDNEIKGVILDDVRKVTEWKQKLDLIVQGLGIHEEEEPPTTIELIQEILKRVASIFLRK